MKKAELVWARKLGDGRFGTMSPMEMERITDYDVLHYIFPVDGLPTDPEIDRIIDDCPQFSPLRNMTATEVRQIIRHVLDAMGLEVRNG